MLKHMLGCCKIYISESRNKSSLESIEKAAKLFPEAKIINKFEDEIYNRVGYTLVAKIDPQESLKNAVFAMVKSAFQTVNLECHSGSHPRLGVVDHVCFHPLGGGGGGGSGGGGGLGHVAGIAQSLADDIRSQLQVPTFLYGAAHEEGMSLDSIRRELGYFTPNSTGHQWTGGPQSGVSDQEFQRKGFAIIGATKWVDNYNIPVYTNDIALVRKIAKKVSGRGGGLLSVQSMALAHGDGVIEVACNLLDPSKVSGVHVQLEVDRLAKEEGVTTGKGYYTDFSQEQIIESYLKLDSQV